MHQVIEMQLEITNDERWWPSTLNWGKKTFKDSKAVLSGLGRKSGLVVIILYSRFEGCKYKCRQILDGNGVKAIQNWFLYPILVHLIIEKKENIDKQMWQKK